MRPRVINYEETIVWSQDQSCNGVQRVLGLNSCGTGTSGCAVLEGVWAEGMAGWLGWLEGGRVDGRIGNN